MQISHNFICFFRQLLLTQLKKTQYNFAYRKTVLRLSLDSSHSLRYTDII